MTWASAKTECEHGNLRMAYAAEALVDGVYVKGVKQGDHWLPVCLTARTSGSKSAMPAIGTDGPTPARKKEACMQVLIVHRRGALQTSHMSTVLSRNV